MKKILQIILSSLVVIFSVQTICFAAWTGPTLTPPFGNLAAPMNLGSTQSKTGGLNIAGNVGIGTTNPQGILTVQATSRSTAFAAGNGATWHDLILRNPNSTAGSAVGMFFETSGYHSNAGTGIAAIDAGGDYSADLVFITRPNGAIAQERMRIRSDGNVGIGVTSPDTNYKLTTTAGGIKAESTTQPAGYFSSSSGYGLLVNAGNVGIGTVTPAAKLDVNGNIYVSATNPVAGPSYYNVQKEQNVSAVSVAAAGWYRVAHIDGGVGRGQNTVTIYTTGGAYGPYSVTLRWWHDWSSLGGVSAISERGGGYWNQARVTDDGANSYLEVYFTGAITSSLSMSLQYDGGFALGSLYSGTLPAGGGTVRATAPLGYLTIGSDKFFVNSSGQVGIGVTAPATTLDVYGQVLASRTGLPAFVLNSAGSYYGQINQTGSDTWSLGYGATASAIGTNVLTWNGSGKVGIGTTAPVFNLDVTGTIGFRGNQSAIVHYNGDGTMVALTGVRSDVAGTGNFTFYGYNGLNWNFWNGNVIVNVGNVGIGTTAPGAKLEINGSAGASQIIKNTGNSGWLRFDEAGATRGYLGYGDDGTTFSGALADSMSLRAEGALHLGGSGNYLTMTLVSGNVGIGTASPASKLSVLGGGVSVGYIGVAAPTNGLIAAGNVGIGTSNPTSLLHTKIGIDGSIGGPSLSNNTAVANLRLENNSAYLDIGRSMVGSPFPFWMQAYAAGTTLPLSIQPLGGNVGIGTTAPTVQLERACPSGFVNLKSGNNQIGCLQADERGSNVYETAVNDCYTTYGGRLPSGQEFTIACLNTTGFSNLTDDLETVGDMWYHTNWESLVIDCDLAPKYSSRAYSASGPYRCFIPR